MSSITVAAPQVIELGGSPTIKLNRKGGSATRKFLFAQADLAAFALHCFPSPVNGYGTWSAFPGLPWLVVTDVDIAPFDPDGPDGNQGTNGRTLNKYTKGGYVGTLSYTVPQDDQQQQSGPGGDNTGPGGDQGSTGNNQDQPVTFVKHSLSIGGEILQWPAAGLEWEFSDQFDARGNLQAVADKGEVRVTGNAMVGCVIPIIEHQIQWSYVLQPPWSAIRSCVGRVNQKAFAGASRETLLFLGVEAEREITSAGAKTWTITYKFSEKNYTSGPQSWNHFLRPATGRFERIKKKRLTDASGNAAGATVAMGFGKQDTKISVSHEGNTFPNSVPFRIKILGEEMLVTDVQPNGLFDVLTVQRDINNNGLTTVDGEAIVESSGGFIYDFADFSRLFPGGVQ